jgi:site-specific DNA-methyltransferase (cytosine-N4-specific)
VPKSDIPIGSEFGPNQVELATVIRLAKENEGDSAALDRAVSGYKGWPPATAKNTRLSLGKYGLIDEEGKLTEVAERLLALEATPDAMHAEFARHIFFHLHGLEVVGAIDAIRNRGENPTQVNISQFLGTLGIYASASSTHLSKMIGWLQRAGVFELQGTKVRYETLNMARVEELTGATTNDLDILAEMPSDERAILKVLASMPMPNIPDTEPIEGNLLRETAESHFGETYDPKSFPSDVLKPLAEAGYITIGKSVKATGQEAGTREQVSGKTTLVYRTEKFANEHLLSLVDALSSTGLAVRNLLRKPLSEILTELESDDKNIKGKALEALAFHLMRLLHLEFRAWRKRPKESSGFEVDLIVEDARISFSRWQIQCKNTPDSAVRLEDVAKEVGLAITLKSNVILVVTTGRFGRDAKSYAEDVTAGTALNVVLLDGNDLRQIIATPLQMTRIMNERAKRAMELKKL